MGFVVQLFVGAVQGAGTIIDQFSGSTCRRRSTR